MVHPCYYACSKLTFGTPERTETLITRRIYAMSPDASQGVEIVPAKLRRLIFHNSSFAVATARPETSERNVAGLSC